MFVTANYNDSSGSNNTAIGVAIGVAIVAVVVVVIIVNYRRFYSFCAEIFNIQISGHSHKKNTTTIFTGKGDSCLQTRKEDYVFLYLRRISAAKSDWLT